MFITNAVLIRNEEESNNALDFMDIRKGTVVAKLT